MAIIKSGLLASAALALAAILATPASAQAAFEYQKPKTSWGAPDLQGFWTNTSLTAMQRPAGADKLVLNEEEAEKLNGKSRAPPKSTRNPPSSFSPTRTPRAPITGSGWTPGKATPR
jgi:hypothetical protein